MRSRDTMWKKILLVPSLAVLLILPGCQSDLRDEIVGRWRMDPVTMSADMHDVYPEEDVLDFSEDGTWNGDPENTWTVLGDTITMDAEFLVFPYTYDVRIDGDVMTLSYEDITPITFRRVESSVVETTGIPEVPFVGVYEGMQGSRLWIWEDGTCQFEWVCDGSVGTGSWSVDPEEKVIWFQVSNLEHRIYADISRSKEVLWMEKEGSYRQGVWEDEVFQKRQD